MTVAHDDRLFGDPLFQLNLMLWALKPVAPGAPTRPVLADAGYVVNSISRTLSPGPRLQGTFKALTGSEKGPSPDVIAEPTNDVPWMIIECKRSGFSSVSPTARQARKLISIKVPFIETVGKPGSPERVVLLYIVRNSRVDDFADTLAELSVEMSEHADVCVVALGVVKRMSDGVGFQLVRKGDHHCVSAGYDTLIDFLSPECVVLEVEDGEDPRPLYFVPYDPSLDYDDTTLSTRDEAKFDLLLRAGMAAITLIGPEAIPARVSLSADDLLRKATYNMSAFWGTSNEISRLRELIMEYIVRLISRAFVPAPNVERSGGTVRVTLISQKQKEAVIDALSETAGPGMRELEAAAAQTELPLYPSDKNPI